MPFGQRLDGHGAFCGRGDLAIDHESEFLARLRSRSCIIDGEAVACDERGIAAFDRIRYRRDDGCVFQYVFDLICISRNSI